MFNKLRNKLWNRVFKAVATNTPHKAIVTIACDSNTYHPPLQNRKCHHNAAWHLKNNKDVVAVAKGFYKEADEYPIAHFICLDVWGNWFDPTLPTTYIKDNKFYVNTIYKSEEEFGQHNADSELMDMKRIMYNSLSGWKKWLCWWRKEYTF